MWYTDGISIFKSSRYSIWPFYLVINELPYQERFKMENLILIGLWSGHGKPDANLFLSPFVDNFKNLLRGIRIEIPHLNLSPLIRGLILWGTGDLPAKSLFLNFKQFNAKFGCMSCEDKGESVGKKVIFPYVVNSKSRTDESTFEYAVEAQKTHGPVCGVKGPSVLSKIVYSFIRSTAFDGMHCLYQGCSKKLNRLLFETKYSRENFSISQHIDLIDSRLSRVKFPSFVQRNPRSIFDIKYYKISELKNFTLNCMPIFLHDLLPPEQFEHLKLFFFGTYTLNKSSIGESEVAASNRAFNKFYSEFENHYPRIFLTQNFHILKHAADSVKNVAPLYISACFKCEDMNGKLANLVHGSRLPEIQVLNGLNMFLNLFQLRHEIMSKDSKAYIYCNEILSPTQKVKKRIKISENVYVASKLTFLKNLPNEFKTLLRPEYQSSNFSLFTKLYIRNTLFTSVMYQNGQKNEDLYVKYLVQNNCFFAKIQFFLRITHCHCKKVCECPAYFNVFIRKITVTPPDFINIEGIGELSYIHKINCIDEDYTAINLENLSTVCFHINLEDKNEGYIVEPVNMLEDE